MLHSSKRTSFALYAVFAMLLMLFIWRLGLASLFKPFWDDETAGAANSYIRSYSNIILSGISEANPSPLYYVISKLWYSLWDYHAQEYWNLRLFQRLPHVFAWAVASSASFLWTVRILKKHATIRTLVAAIIGIGVAFFIHSNSFAAYYAIEDRPYMFWLSLTMLQTFLFAETALLGSSKKMEYYYALISIILVLTTFTSLAITGMQLFVLWAAKERNKSFAARGAILLAVCACIGFWYFHKVPKMDYGIGWFTWKNYHESITEVVAKTFHHHNAAALLFSLPLTLGIVIASARRSLAGRALLLYLLLHLVLTFVLFKGSEFKGGLWASRYVIFLVPPSLLLYFFSLWKICEWINEQSRKTRFKHAGTVLIVIWALAQTASQASTYVAKIKEDMAAPQAVKHYGKTTSADCPEKFANFTAIYFEEANNICRGLPKSH